MSKLQSLEGELTLELETGHVTNGEGKVVFSLPFAVITKTCPKALAENPTSLRLLNAAIVEQAKLGFPERQALFDRITSTLHACEEFEDPEDDVDAIASASYRLGVAFVANAMVMALSAEKEWSNWVDHVHPKALECLPSDIPLFQKIQKAAREMAAEWNDPNTEP